MSRPLNPRAALAKARGIRPATLEIRERAAMRGGDALPMCPTCGSPPAARAGEGLSQIYCRQCCQRANRHGSHFKTTYPAATLRPYRHAAQRFLRAHLLDTWIVHALHALAALMDHAGPVERVVDVYRLPPADKARAALARMRRREVPPERLLVNYLAVCCAIATDPISPGSETANYRRVQAAKVCARTAASNDGYYSDRLKNERYARSTGQALVHLGRWLEEACEHVETAHLAAILELARAGTTAAPSQRTDHTSE
ncbi:hypothetical protein [Methylobacterium sp. E-045]|uniref:hypothetical protein n=1 Tax=Methylobacterium sp. E-045 TaxID=2836575 RepID=UPI001FBB78B3|nr:hypothetical protein [Methylobacterium sp. E-045]MCJ2132298.1 hypothetical protein [Methylobacterium sp. E-045]